MTDQIDDGDLEEWRHKQITQKIWQMLCKRHQPLEALLTCSPEMVYFYRGQAEILRDLAAFFEIKNSY